MTTRRSVGLLAFAAALAIHATAQAVVITDVTTNTNMFYDNFETASPVSTVPAPDASGVYHPTAVIGSWLVPATDPAASTQVTNSTTSPDPGPFQGTQYLRMYRDSKNEGGTAVGVDSSAVTTPGDVMELRTMVYLPSGTDANARGQIFMVGSATGSGSDFLTSVAWARGDGAGNVDAIIGNGSGGNLAVVPTGLHYATNVWQEWDLTYKIGSPTYSVTVNGVTASGFLSPQIGGVAGLSLSNGNDTPAGSVYFDAVRSVPEPSSLVLLALAGLGAALWRRMKR